VALGPAIRRLLGPRLALAAGRRYRAVFVDLDKVADTLAVLIPKDAHLLDIGGGDGEPLNRLLARRPDIRVTTIDPAPVVGQWIETRFETRVVRMPGTDIMDYLAKDTAAPQAVLLADVMHHVPPASRPALVRCLGKLLERNPTLKIIVKDIEPGTWRAQLSYWADHYITGDRGVRLISQEDLQGLFAAELGRLRCERSDLIARDSPNYAVAFSR
jgi:2-polyprenyl-3-methyl-5-hydroxy-6-metoxy-1,4-benzoquinol methylase